MIFIRYCYLLAVLVAIHAGTEEKPQQTNFLQSVFDFLEPYVVNLANNALGNNNHEGDGDISTADEDYDLSEEESDEDDEDDRTIFNMFKKKKKKKKNKKKKKKKPQVENPHVPEKPDNSDEPDETVQKPFKPADKPSQPKPKPKPSTHEIKPGYEVTTATDPADNTTPQKFNTGLNGVSDETKMKHPLINKLPALFPNRKVIQVTTTVVVHTTVVNTIFPSCLKVYNAHSVCPSHTNTLPSGNIWRSEVPNSGSERTGNKTERDEGRELDDQSMPKIQPTATIQVQTTKAATLDGKHSRSFNGVTSIEDTGSVSDMLSSAQTATPDLASAHAENDTSAEGRMLPFFLKPKVEYTTKFLDATVTKDIYDYSHTATVIAVNCIPAEAKTLPPCLQENPSPVAGPSDEAYHSHFIQMVKGQNQLVPNLSTAEDHYLSTSVLPPYYETTKHSAGMDERVLQDGLQNIRQMVFEFMLNQGQQQNNER